MAASEPGLGRPGTRLELEPGPGPGPNQICINNQQGRAQHIIMGLLWSCGSQVHLEQFNHGTKREFKFKEGPVSLEACPA